MRDDPQPTSGPRSARDAALAIVRRLRDAGHVAYFAGGCVRDALLGLEPKDYDVATDAPPGRVRELFRRTQAVGAAFGVILVRDGRSEVEVATFRSEGSYLDGRRPERVTFTTAEEDATRRDFTINGLFYDPIDDRTIDFVGGQADLKSRVLRAIGDPNARFAEDHLRLLRAVRFAARFDLAIEARTHDAIVRHATFLTRISSERIADELRRMLTPPTRVAAWAMLHEFSLDDVIFRFVRLPEQSTHPDALVRRTSIVREVAPGKPISFGLALASAALDYGIAKLRFDDCPDLSVRQIVNGLRQSLRISNDESDVVEGSLHGLEQLIQRREPSVAMLKRFLARPTASHSRTLLDALPDETVPSRDAMNSRLDELAKTDYAPPPFVSGDDLTAAGLQPGKSFKLALDVAYDAQLELRATTKDQALRIAIDIARENA